MATITFLFTRLILGAVLAWGMWLCWGQTVGTSSPNSGSYWEVGAPAPGLMSVQVAVSRVD